MPINALPRDATVFGIDLGKNVFHVVGTDKSGAVVQRLKFRRDKVLAFFETAAPALIGMEACPGSQWLARRLEGMGHTVRMMPAHFVKPYLKTNKSDTLDAEAIAEAVTRPSMRFVPVKTVDQVDIQALHRIRDQMIGKRTALTNQMRAFCLEDGTALRQGANFFKADFSRVLADEDMICRLRCGGYCWTSLKISIAWSCASGRKRRRSKLWFPAMMSRAVSR